MALQHPIKFQQLPHSASGRAFSRKIAASPGHQAAGRPPHANSSVHHRHIRLRECARLQSIVEKIRCGRPTGVEPWTLLYANEEPGRGHLSPISDSPFAPGTFSRAQPSWQGTWLVFRARDFRVFQRADAPFFWAVELRVHDHKGFSCDKRERERECLASASARDAPPRPVVFGRWSFRLVWKI
jgi:hypothetical protein